MTRHRAVAVFADRRLDLVRTAARITGDQAEAEDVVQDAWLRFSAATPLRPVAETGSYIHSIVRNLALDGRRRRAREQRRVVDDAGAQGSEIASDMPCAERQLMAADELRLVYQTLGELPDRVRMAVILHRCEGLKLKDIASRLGVSTTVAHGLVAKGIDACRRTLRAPR